MKTHEAIHLLKTKKYKYIYNYNVSNPIMFEYDHNKKVLIQHVYYDDRGLDGGFGTMSLNDLKSLEGISWEATNLKNGRVSPYSERISK